MKKTWISIILGFLVLLSGLVPLLNTFGVISVKLPEFISTVFLALVGVGGIYLVIDAIIGFIEMIGGLAWVGLIVGVLLSFMGIVPLLMRFNLIANGLLEKIFSLSSVVVDYFYVFAGLVLIVFGLRFALSNL